MRQSAYVVALGDRGRPIGYLIDGKSVARLSKFRDVVADMLEARSGYRGAVTYGPIVEMSYNSLRNEIKGFDWFALPCLSMKGIVTAQRNGSEWKFTCETEDKRIGQGRYRQMDRSEYDLPPPSTGLARRNPVDYTKYSYEVYFFYVESDLIRIGYDPFDARRLMKDLDAFVRGEWKRNTPTDQTAKNLKLIDAGRNSRRL